MGAAAFGAVDRRVHGHHGLRDQLRDCLKSGDGERGQALITDEILDQFAVVARWDDVADRMIERYKGNAIESSIDPRTRWNPAKSPAAQA